MRLLYRYLPEHSTVLYTKIVCYLLSFPLHLPELAGKKELEGYKEFIREYSTQLKGIEEALDETRGDAWDFTFDPIALHVSVVW